MQFKILLLLPFLFVLTKHLIAIKTVAHVYWRPYKNTIPKDVFLVDPNNKTGRHYIGRAPVKQTALFQGIITEGDPNVYVAYPYWRRNRTARAIDIFPEILCSDKPEKLKWVDANYKNVSSLKEKLVWSGYYIDSLTTFYIGRVKHDNVYVSGRISKYNDYYMFYLTGNNSKIYLTQTYQALTIDE